EAHALERHARAHPVAVRGVAAEHRLAGVLEQRMRGEERLEPTHPFGARAGLAVGNARRLGAEHAGDRFGPFGRIAERNAADEMDVIGGHASSPRSAAVRDYLTCAPHTLSCRPPRRRGPIIPGHSMVHGVWVPAFAGTTAERFAPANRHRFG